MVDLNIGQKVLVLEDVGTTTRTIRHPESDQVSRRDDYEPQLQATVRNHTLGHITAQGIWELGGQDIVSAEETVPAGGSEVLAQRIHWGDLPDNRVPGAWDLSATLLSGSRRLGTASISWPEQQSTWGTIETVAFNPTNPDDPDDNADVPSDEDGDDDSEESSDGGPSSSIPTLPPIGPLTGPQATLAALGVVAVVVLR